MTVLVRWSTGLKTGGEGRPGAWGGNAVSLQYLRGLISLPANPQLSGPSSAGCSLCEMVRLPTGGHARVQGSHPLCLSAYVIKLEAISKWNRLDKTYSKNS